MINIHIDNAFNLKNDVIKESAYISFDYDPSIVEILKSLGTRSYIAEEHLWEVPLYLLPNLIGKLWAYDVEVQGYYEEAQPLNELLPAEFSFKTDPFSHQIDGVLYGLNSKNFILGDEQGLGKTKQIIDLAVALKHRDGIKHCLIICGVNTLKYNWEQEIKTHSNESVWILGNRWGKVSKKWKEGGAKEKLEDLMNIPEQFFWIINIEGLRGLSTIDPATKNKKHKKYLYPIANRIEQLCKHGEIGLIAFDEAHKARNPDTHQGKALLSMQSAEHKIAMTGTPLVNSPLDLFVPLKWIGVETHSFYEYQKHYCKFGGFNNSDIVGYKNLDQLKDLSSSVLLRRKKADVLDLPPKIYTNLVIDMHPHQRQLYDEVKKFLKSNLQKIKMSNNPMEQIIRLRQVTSAPELVSTTIQVSAKLDALEELVEDITSSGNKVLVFSNWEEVCKIAINRLSKYNPAKISGSVKVVERKDQENRFQNDPDCKVLVGTIGAMGTGLTLTAATYVIFLDEPWNRAIKEQAEDRTHRIGTKGTINIITLLTVDSVDTWVNDIVYRKGAMSDLLIDGTFEDPRSRQAILSAIEQLLS